MNKKNKRIAAFCMMLVMLCAAMFATVITGSALGISENTAAVPALIPMVDVSGVTTFLNEISSALKIIAGAIALISVIALAIVLIAGGAQGLQKAKPFAISIGVGIVVLAAGPDLLSALMSSAGA